MDERDRLQRFVLRGPRWRAEELPAEAGLLLVVRGPVEVDGVARDTGAAIAFEGRLTLRLRAVRTEAVLFVGPRAASAELSAEQITADAVLGAVAPILRDASTRPEVAAPLARAFLARVRERSGAAPRVTDPRVQRALEIVESDLSRRPTIVELAGAVGLCRAAFTRRFRRALGESPDRYLTGLRLRRAARRLVSSDDGLAAIAHEIGYASEFAFGRAFKRRFGVSPGAYRRGWSEPARMAA